VTGHPPPEEGFCVCGRPLPEQPVSDWACSEPCQSAWLHHHADPGYPHPREIREAADRALETASTAVRSVVLSVDSLAAAGTEITVDPFVPAAGHWQPAGMWTPLQDALGDAARYRRWCPACRGRRDSQLYPDSNRQECATCGHRWPGRPLLGWVETRGAPWPGIRLLLSDGQRSAAMAFSPEEVQAAGDRMAERLLRSWLRLERQLCGGYADVDQPTERQQQRAARQLQRGWHAYADLQ